MGELIRNVRVQEALDAWATTKDNRTFSDVVRRAIAGDLLLDISTSQLADRQKGPQPGDRLAIASQLDNAGKRVLLAYTDNERLGARSPENTLSLGQPGFGVIEQVFREYEGLVIDAGHPGMFIAYTAELRRALGDEPEAAARLARDLEKRERPFDDFLAGLALAPVAAARARRSRRCSPRRRRSGRGPPEVEARPTRLQNVARVALKDGHAGAIVNPAGPAAPLPPALLAQYVGAAEE
jgi:hypothetical protein